MGKLPSMAHRVPVPSGLSGWPITRDLTTSNGELATCRWTNGVATTVGSRHRPPPCNRCTRPCIVCQNTGAAALLGL